MRKDAVAGALPRPAQRYEVLSFVTGRTAFDQLSVDPERNSQMLPAMKASRLLQTAVCLALTALPTLHAKESPAFDLREGDIVFSSSARGQGEAVIAATGSPYTHCGIVFEKDGQLMVLEAVQPVGVTTLKDFIAHSRPEIFTARRLKFTVTPEARQKAREWALAQIGRDYDARFAWDDGKLYCSELVWKIYQHAGVELCPPRHFRDYDLQRPAVRKIVEQRYGGMDRLPLDEKVVAPSDLAASGLLMEVPRKAE